MKKTRLFAAALAACMVASALFGCVDSSQQSVTVETDYDAQAAVDKYAEYVGELSEEDKNYTIQMGYNNCDHMVAALVGQGAGIYDALGLKVNITKTGNIDTAMSSGDMDCGYLGIDGAINANNNGAPLYMAAANHLGGSRYLVVSNDIQGSMEEIGQQLLGKQLAIGGNSVVKRPEWHTWAGELGIDPDPTTGGYEAISMGSTDALIAMKAGQLAAFTC